MYAKDKDKAKSPPRPFVPRLAANTAFAKSAPPPRLNSTAFNSSPSSSPASRRPLAGPNGSSTPRSGTVEHGSTPANKVISDNITPRSSARTSRLSSAGSTPRATIGDIEGSAETVSAIQTKLSGIGESFFHASDGPLQSPPRRPTLQRQTTSFIYANGLRDEPKAMSDKGNVHQDLPSGDRLESHASVTSWFEKSPSNITGANVTPTTSRPTSSVSAPVAMHMFNSVSPRSPRAPSPTKQNFHLSYRKGASQIIPLEDSRQSFHALSMHQAANIDLDSTCRPSSLDTISEPGEGELPRSILSARDSPFDSIHELSPAPSLPLGTRTNPSSTSPTKPVGFAESGSYRLRTPSISSRAISGVLSTPLEEDRDRSQMESQQSMAVKARQERKVLDLEISNSSLLAINRSLEREMRKQKVELRRFRRLSRNPNRSSWLSDATSLVDLDDLEGHEEQSDREEDDDDDDDDEAPRVDLDELTDQESGSEEAMSPTALAEHDARHLARDEKRLRLDLSKHKELLIDSQKMNSSLRRCLGITEQLIKDGGRALEYQVDVADVQLGGRVLSPEELDLKPEWQEEADSYFLSTWSKASDRLSAGGQQLLAESDLGTDKDSGVDLEYGRMLLESAGKEMENA